MVHTSPTPRGEDRSPEHAQESLHDVIEKQEHVLTTHLAVIEGWLGLFEDDALDKAQCRRAARVVRERTEALRLDLGALLSLVKESMDPEDTEEG